MPDLLFLNIRRYKYNPKRGETQSEHELLRSSEPGLLDGGPRQSFDYVLYSVVVHKGRTPNQGHYFSFVNVSKQISERKWIEFNDSIVSETTVDKVLNNYTGKRKESVYLNEVYGKWDCREEASEETAYLLIYFRKEFFEKYQNMEIELSSSIKQKLAEKLTEEEAKTKTAVKIYVLRKEEEVDLFSPRLDLIELKLLKAGLFEEEMQNY